MEPTCKSEVLCAHGAVFSSVNLSERVRYVKVRHFAITVWG